MGRGGDGVGGVGRASGGGGWGEWAPFHELEQRRQHLAGVLDHAVTALVLKEMRQQAWARWGGVGVCWDGVLDGLGWARGVAGLDWAGLGWVGLGF